MKTTAATRQDPSLDGSMLELLDLADRCVKCGLCLPHCPTYGKTRHEADSPRGRIALIQGWAMGDLALTKTLTGHLDGCLTCRACETVCPSLVAYGRIADTAKAQRVAALPAWRRWLGRLWLIRLSDSRWMDRLERLARLYRWLGLSHLANVTRFARARQLSPYHRLAAVIGGTARRILPPACPEADFELFVGCLGDGIQSGTIAATLDLCTRLGLRVALPTVPRCCGALLRHNGYPEEADRRRADCAAHRPAARPLVGMASACVAELREHPALSDTQELCAYLDRFPWPTGLSLRPLARRVLVHEPCSHRNLLGGNAAVYRLLARIPELEAAPLPGNANCCGAAGTYMLQQPYMSDQLLQDKLAPIIDQRPDILVTTNPGCALHLAAGIHEAGLAVEVCHPVELLARQSKPYSE